MVGEETTVETEKENMASCGESKTEISCVEVGVRHTGVLPGNPD